MIFASPFILMMTLSGKEKKCKKRMKIYCFKHESLRVHTKIK